MKIVMLPTDMAQAICTQQQQQQQQQRTADARPAKSRRSLHVPTERVTATRQEEGGTPLEGARGVRHF
jgi:hypothetical protein